MVIIINIDSKNCKLIWSLTGISFGETGWGMTRQTGATFPMPIEIKLVFQNSH